MTREPLRRIAPQRVDAIDVGLHGGRQVALLAAIAAHVHRTMIAQVGKSGVHLRSDRARVRTRRHRLGPQLGIREAVGQMIEDCQRFPNRDVAIDQYWTMAHAASLDATDRVYLDTTRDGGVVAHPTFPVCVEWPAVPSMPAASSE